jgi:hypothetical protein
VPGAGWIARDPMDTTGARVGSSSTTATARPERTVLCDACAGEGVRHQQRCVYCDGQGRRQLHAFNLHLQPEDDADADPLDDAIDRRNNAGHYHELEQALVGIRVHVNKPVRYRWLTDNATAALRLLDALYLPPATRLEQQLTPPNAPSSTSPSRTSTAACLTRSVSPPPSAPTSSSSPAAAPARKAAAPTRTRWRGVTWRSGSITGRGRPAQWIAAEYGLSVSTVYEVLNGVTA